MSEPNPFGQLSQEQSGDDLGFAGALRTVLGKLCYLGPLCGPTILLFTLQGQMGDGSP